MALFASSTLTSAPRLSASASGTALEAVLFNEDLLAYTFEFMAGDESLAIRLVNKLFASSFMWSYRYCQGVVVVGGGGGGGGGVLPPRRTDIRHFCGSLSALQWLVSVMRAPLSNEMCFHSAESGCVEGLQWLRSQNPRCPWDATSCNSAAHNGHLSTIHWLRSPYPPCPWDIAECRAQAAANGKYDVVVWLDEVGGWLTAVAVSWCLDCWLVMPWHVVSSTSHRYTDKHTQCPG